MNLSYTLTDDSIQWSGLLELSLNSSFTDSRFIEFAQTYDIFNELDPDIDYPSSSISDIGHINALTLSNIFETDGNGKTILKENTQYYARVLYVTDNSVKNVIISDTSSFITPIRSTP
jgi:hypothetical protein